MCYREEKWNELKIKKKQKTEGVEVVKRILFQPTVSSDSDRMGLLLDAL